MAADRTSDQGSKEEIAKGVAEAGKGEVGKAGGEAARKGGRGHGADPGKISQGMSEAGSGAGSGAKGPGGAISGRSPGIHNEAWRDAAGPIERPDHDLLRQGASPSRRSGAQAVWPSNIWHLDEIFVKIGGRQMYLWRAVDSEGEVLDMLVQRHRDKRAALRLLRNLLKKRMRPLTAAAMRG